MLEFDFIKFPFPWIIMTYAVELHKMGITYFILRSSTEEYTCSKAPTFYA